MLIIFFLLIFVSAFCFLIDKDFSKYKKATNKKIKYLNKRIRNLENNQNIIFEYILSIYDDIERYDNDEVEKECK